jgi:deoxyhypusine synthase
MQSTPHSTPHSAANSVAPHLGPVGQFLRQHFRHFNAAALMDAAEGYRKFLDGGGRMMMTLAGAMSTAELGLSLAEMIRRDLVHLIVCTGANLEEDIFNLVAHDFYERVPHYRDLTPQDEAELLARHMNRVTDTCIPEMEAMRRIEKRCSTSGLEPTRRESVIFPTSSFGRFWRREPSAPPTRSIHGTPGWWRRWRRRFPMVVPGWEDSTLGNMYAAAVIRGDVKNVHTVRSGIEYMTWLADHYLKTTSSAPLGMFQIGGGIAGDFPICVVPMLHQDLEMEAPLWGYFCQISDSTTSYGSYSGAVPNEKITWGKLGVETPKFVIESDATIVAPLIFAYLLGW